MKTYKNRTEYNRTKASGGHYKKSFAMDIFKNKELNFYDIGLLIWLLSNTKKYVVNKGMVLKRSGIPEKKFLNSWNKLEKLGHIGKRSIQGGVEWIINEMPRSYNDQSG